MLKRLLFILALVLLAHSANATTIYFAGSEDTDFGSNGSCSGASGNNVTRPDWAFGAISASGSTPACSSPVYTPISNFWVHGQAFPTGSTSTSGDEIIALYDAGGVKRLVVRGTGTAGQLKISTRNAAGTYVDLVTASSNFTASTVQAIDLQVNYAVSGSVTLYIAGVQVATFSGNITTDSATTLAQVGYGQANSANHWDWSECIVSDSDTRGMGLLTLNPTASGSTQSWTPNTVGDVSKAFINDSTSISTSTNNALSEWTIPTGLPTGNYQLLAVAQSARVEIGATGPTTFTWLMNVNGVNKTTGSNSPLVGSFSNFNGQIWSTNPNTGSAWNFSDLSGLQLGIESMP